MKLITHPLINKEHNIIKVLRWDHGSETYLFFSEEKNRCLYLFSQVLSNSFIFYYFCMYLKEKDVEVIIFHMI